MGKSIKKTDLVPVDPVVGWQADLRQAAYNALNGDDVKQIVEAIVKKAKQGDPQACKMVFEYLLGGKGSPGAPASPSTVNNVQVNYTGPTKDSPAAKPIRQARLEHLRERASNGEALFHREDALANLE